MSRFRIARIDLDPAAATGPRAVRYTLIEGGGAMANAGIQTVDEYLATQPEAVREALERVRGAIRRALPGAEEAISYRIPVYKLGGVAVIYFAGWQRHYSLYPASPAMKNEFAAELAPYKVKKGTIRFPLAGPVPLKLIARIAKFRAGEAAQKKRRTAP